jgi:hypothetical protein
MSQLRLHVVATQFWQPGVREQISHINNNGVIPVTNGLIKIIGFP